MDYSSAVLDAIKKYDRIVISRHIRPDGDAIGSALGLREIIRLTWPNKTVLCVNKDSSKNLAFLGEDDEQPESYTDTLVIIVDTSTVERIANPRFGEGACVVKLDHHLSGDSFGDIEWVESFRSSACELVASFYNDHRDELRINRQAATCLYAGMITDSGRFKYPNTTPETLRLAALMLEQDIDVSGLNAKLDLVDLKMERLRARVINEMQCTSEGVLFFIVTKNLKLEYGLSEEDASMLVDFMDSVRGCPIWLLFVEQEGSIRVRLRSRFIQITGLAEKYHGGGHANACGSKVYSLDELCDLINDANAMLAEYRIKNPEIL